MLLKRKLFSILALSASVAAFSVFTAAQDTTTNSSDSTEKYEKHGGKGWGKRGENGKGMRGGKHMMRGLRGIELTDVQKEQLRVIHENNKPSAAAMLEFKAMRHAKRDGGTITPEQKEKLKALKLQMREKRAQIHQQILAILTPEQRNLLETRKEEMREKHEERRELRKQQKPSTQTPTVN